MQTLPFVAPKANVMSRQVEPVSSKQADESATPFTQVLSKQIAKEGEKPQAEDVQKKAETDAAELARVVDGAEKTVEKQDVDAQLLALDATVKAIQDATDGQVALDAPKVEEHDAVKQTLPVLTNATPIIKTVVDDKVNQAIAGQAKQGSDVEPLGQQQGKASVAVKATAVTAAVSQQKEPAQLDADIVANDKFAQSLATESKIKSVQDAAISKAVSGVSDVNTVTVATAPVQQPLAKLTTTPVPQAASENHIPVYPGKTGWNEAVSQKIVWMVGATEQSAKLTLNPPQLGPLEITIQVNNDKADATFISESPEVRKALEEGVSTLKQLMGQAGVELGQTNINSSKQQQAFQQAQLMKQGTDNASTPMDTPENTAGSVISRQSNGLVDIFA